MSNLQPVRRPQLPQETTPSISLRDVILVLFRRRWIILAIALPIILIASLGLFKRTGLYVASCQTLLELRGSQEPTWSPGTAHVDENRSLSTYRHLAMSAPVAVLAADAILDSMPRFVQRHKEFRPLRDKNNLAGYIWEHLDVNPLGESSILEIRFNSPDFEFSILACGAVRDAFMKFSISALRNNQAVEYYEDQMGIVRSQIDSLLGVRSTVLRENGYTLIEADFRYESGQLMGVEEEYFDVASDRHEIEELVNQMKQGLARDPNFFPVADKSLVETPLVHAKLRLDRHRDQLNVLLGTYPEGSVQILRQRELIASSEKMLRASVKEYIAGLEVTLQSIRAKERERRAQIVELKRLRSLAPSVYRSVTLLDGEIKGRSELLEALQVKSGEVRLTEMADARISRIIKLTEPDIDKYISGSRAFAYFAVISLFGIFFSFMVAFAIDRYDRKIYSASSIEQYLEVPVLGVVTDAKEEKDS